MKYTLGGKSYTTKVRLKQVCQEMLSRYSDRQQIAGEDDLFLRDLIHWHPDSKHKIGCGVDYFFKNRTAQPTGSCFWIRRLDGTVVDFSYKKTIDGSRDTLNAMFSKACRWAVLKDILDAKENHFMQYGNSDGLIECELTGRLIDRTEAQADHAPPMVFAAIVCSFKALTFDEITPDIFKPEEDGATVIEFKDSRVVERFLTYHYKVAKLRMVAKDENYRIAPLHFTPPIKRPLQLKKPSIVTGVAI
jgi:hypothetical protein